MNDDGHPLETITTQTTWEQSADVISPNALKGSTWVDCANNRTMSPITYVRPVNTTRTVERWDSLTDPPPPTPTPDASYTTISSGYDNWGNVGSVAESSTDGLTRTTTLTYWQNPTTNMMVGRPQGRDPDPGGTKCYQYDALGRVTTTVTNPGTDDVTACTPTEPITGGQQVTYSYHADGNLHRQTDINTPNNRVTTHENYQYGKPRDTIITTGATDDIHFCRNYGPLGTITWETDGRGCDEAYRTNYTYDTFGHVTSVDPPLSDPTTFTYVIDWNYVDVIRSGQKVLYGFDRFGGLINIYNYQTSNWIQLQNDALGRRRQAFMFWNPGDGDTHLYDPLGRPTAIVHPDSPATQITIEYAGSQIKRTDEIGHVTQSYYEAFGDPNDSRLASVLDSEANTTIYQYDPVFGNLESVTAPIAKGDRSYTYYSATTGCKNGFLSSETHRESGTTNYEYNCLGGLTKRTRPGPETTLYDHDNAGRLTDIIFPGAAGTVTMGYDQASRRTSMTNDSASTTLDYDDRGRLVTVTQNIVGVPQSLITSYAYDALDRLDTITYPSSRVVKYGWNDDNRLRSMTGPDGSWVSYITNVTYHSTGAQDLVTYANGVTTDHGIDTRNRLNEISSTGPGGALVDVTLGYDDASNLTTWDDHLAANLDRTFGYDSLNRLTTATSANLWGTLSYTYDELGNRESLTHNGATTTYVYDPDNRLTDLSGAQVSSFTYDELGRIASEDRRLLTAIDGRGRCAADLPVEIFSDGFESGDLLAWNVGPAFSGVLVYTFNAADQLVRIADGNEILAHNTYDGDGLRVSSGQGTVFYLRDPNGNTLAEYDQFGILIAEYLYTGTKQVAKVVPGGAGGDLVSYFHSDHIGSSLAITDGSGSLTWHGDYFPFGEPFSSNGIADRYRFTQHELDLATGLYYAKARFYHPRIGRFLSTDPVGGNAKSPQSWNRYAYALNNPVKYTDPTGKAPFGSLTEQAIRSEMTPSQVEQFNQIQSEVDAVAAGPMLLFTPGPDELLVVAALKPIGRFAGRLATRFFSKADDASDLKNVVVSSQRHPETAAHISDAQTAGQPSTLTIDRPGAPGRRSQSQAGHDRIPGKDLDEYPPAMFKEGGLGASIRPVSPADNRGAGACIGNQCRKLSDGTQVKIVVK
jgi:RHS repeat-associated protein